MRAYLLAIDVGTSACKVALFKDTGELQAETSVAYDTFYPKNGWAEQDPEDWWRAACEGIKACTEKACIRPAEIAGIGIDGQSWACVPIGKNGEVLANSPIWMDTRAQAICDKKERELGAERIFALSGNPFRPAYTTPKILWFKEYHAHIYERAEYFLQCNSFIVYRLTGAVSQDISQGYGLHVFDIAAKQYDQTLCSALGLDLHKLPPLYESSEIVGRVSHTAAGLTGLTEGIPVAAGGLDAACGTLGAGVCRPGQTQEQGGQAGGMSICLEAPTMHPQLILSPHVIPGQWLLQGGTVGGGGSLKWLAQELGTSEAEIARTGIESQFALLDRLAATVSPGSDGVVFLPYLAGERSPIWDANATGVFYGLRYATGRAHFFRALLEGAAFALRHNLDVAEQAGVSVKEMHAMGGAANSGLWTQIKADITGKHIRVPDSDMATCKGAAILAGVAVGLYPGFDDAVEKLVDFKRVHQPDMRLKAQYDKTYQIYLRLYQQLKPVMAFAAEDGEGE